ncbi:MAG: HEAT repeat domain-containing protein [Acidimicrobiales bacterium]
MVFFVALGILVGSVAVLLRRSELSPLRLGLHLVALVVMLHGTAPLLLREPIYPWVYKHVGVVGYINLHGSVDSRIDIYHNWPGFFTAAAWLTRIASVAGSPLGYAAWSPVYFNLLVCLELGFVFRSLPVTRHVRWLAMFLFVAGNWVGQDYFSPQAAAFVLSLAVFGMVLAWLQTDRPVALMRVARRMASWIRRSGSEGGDLGAAPSSAGPPRVAALGALFFVFSAIVITHQLSPYVVVLGLGVLTAAGMVRPRWVVFGLAAMAIGYLRLHLPYIERTQDLFSSLGNPFANIHNSRHDGSVVMAGRRLTALAAPGMIACLWSLAGLGLLRRLRAGRPTLVLALLAASPPLIALGQSYGGEAVFRIFLFSLPWIALLAASAIEPRPRPGRRPLWSAVAVGLVLSAVLTMFMSAFLGAAELYVVRPGEVHASQYFYDHAQPASDLTLVAPNFPTRVGDRYNEFASGGGNPVDLLTTGTGFRHRMLGKADLPAIARFVEQHGGRIQGSHYLILSTGQAFYSEVLGLLPRGSLASLDEALKRSPDWRVFYRTRDAVIYRLARGSTGAAAHRTAQLVPAQPQPRRAPDRSLDLAGLGAGLVGLGLVGLALRRRQKMANRPIHVVPIKEESMDLNGNSHELTEGAQRAATSELVTPASSPEDLLSQAMLAPAFDRQPFRRAIGELAPEPHRICALIAGVAAGHRADAVRLLGEAWGPIPSTELQPLLEDSSPLIRAAALSALDPSGEAGVLRRRLSDDPSSDVRLAAIGALARTSEADQLEALACALVDPDPRFRTSAVETLPVAATSRAAAQVLTASEDRDEAVRAAAYRRLAAGPSWVLWMAIGWCSRRSELLAVLKEEAAANRLTALVPERPTLLAEAIQALADAEAVARPADGTQPARSDRPVPRMASLRDDSNMASIFPHGPSTALPVPTPEAGRRSDG